MSLMPPVPILPSKLVVKTIFNSIESLGFAHISHQVPPDGKTEIRTDKTLNHNVKKFYLQALKLIEQNDLHGALKNLNLAIELNPHFASAYNDRGLVRYKLGFKKSAVEDLTVAIALNPYRAKYYSNRGFMLTRLEDYNGAIADYNSALMLNPNMARAYFNRGAIHMQIENSLAALADFEAAIRLNPNLGKAYFNRGLTRYKLRELQGGFDDLQRAAELFKQQGRMDYYQEAINKITQLWY